jgi:hypothetical protein
MRKKLALICLLLNSVVFAQPRPLDHLHACLKALGVRNHRVGNGFFVERKDPKDQSGLLVLSDDEMIYFYPASVVAENKNYTLDIWRKDAGQGMQLKREGPDKFDARLLNPGSPKPGTDPRVPVGKEELNAVNIKLFNDLAMKAFDSGATHASDDMKAMKRNLKCPPCKHEPLT